MGNCFIRSGNGFIYWGLFMALCYVPFLFLDFWHGCFIRYVQQKGQSNNRCKFIVNENLYFGYSCKHWIILKNFIINLLKKLLGYVSFVSKYYCCFQKKICYFFSLCFIFVAIVICILSAVTSISLKTKGFLLTFMTDPGNSFYIVWKGGRFLRDLIYEELPAKRKIFLQCSVSLIIWASVTKFTLEIDMKCQNRLFVQTFFCSFWKIPIMIN